MSTQKNDVTARVATIGELRRDVVEGVKRAYGAERAYAVALNGLFAFNWYEVEANDSSEVAKPVHAEKKELYAGLKEINHSNPSTIWARIRKLGKEEREGKAVADTGEGDGEGDGDGNGANANAPRSPWLRNMEELLALYKFNKKDHEGLKPEQAKALALVQDHITAALAIMKVDLTSI